MTQKPSSIEVATAVFIAACSCITGCDVGPSKHEAVDAPVRQPAAIQLPTGVRLDPAAPSVQLGSLPLALAVHPGGRYVVALLNGWREQGIQIFDRTSGRVSSTVQLPAAFLGIAFNRAGDTLFVSGGFHDVIYEFAWSPGQVKLIDSLSLHQGEARRRGQRYPAGIALSADGRELYVVENLADSLAVIDIARHAVRQRLPLGRYPYGIVATRAGHVFASAWGDNKVFEFATEPNGMLSPVRQLPAGRHPSALLLNHADSRLFVVSASTDRVAMFDVASGAKVGELLDSPPAGPKEGSTPNAVALSADERRLFVAEADNNAVAVFDLANDKLLGRVPVEWYPTALSSLGDTLLVVSGKGRGSGPNPDGPTPYHPSEERTRSYTLGQLNGSLMSISESRLNTATLGAFSARVAKANGWNQLARATAKYPPFQHVIYVIKENRTYDEVLGDLPHGDGDSSLVLFPSGNTPNHHALAEHYGVFDRFFVNAEVSADGHNWSTGAYVTDYVEKTEESHYSKRGRTYDYEGLNRGRITNDDASEPANGYLWDLAQRAGISFRNYGEFVSPEGHGTERRYVGNKPFLAAHTNNEYPGFDLEIPDQHRIDVWLKDFQRDVRDGTLPQLTILRLPNDHTAALKAGALTPRALVADNDLAFGRFIEALSKTAYWQNTVVFVLEDDAQNGPDHVDSHRSELFVISAYNAPGVYHRFINTTDVVATIAEILHLGSLSQFDYFGRPLRDVFATHPNLAPYVALAPAQDLNEHNPLSGPGVTGSSELDLSAEDRADEDLFNRVLWRALKGASVPYPGVHRASLLDVRQAM